MRLLVHISIIFVLFSCKQQGDRVGFAKQSNQIIFKPEYSELFIVEKNFEGDTIITIFDPKDKTKVFFKYLLSNVDKQKTSEDVLTVKLPLEKIAVAHSTQVGFISALNLKDKICAVGNSKLLEKGSCIYGKKLPDFFSGYSFDREKLLKIYPSVVFHTPGGSENSSVENDFPIRVVYELSAWETNPLARSEWIKFFAFFLDKTQYADSIFSGIKIKYDSLKKTALNFKDKPKTLSGLPYKNIWYVPSGNSFRSVFYKDASLFYFWENTQSSGSLALDIENVLAKAYSCDVWFFELGLEKVEFTKKDLINLSPMYSNFKAFKQSKIYVCNTNISAFYEKGILEPDKILSDYIFLSREDKFPDYIPFYYRKLK